MNKQRISNILSSIQMNPRDRKDFIDELSKLGQGGQGGGEVSGEHPVRIIELTQEELMGGTELDITYGEYLQTTLIIKTKDILYNCPIELKFLKKTSLHDDEGPTYLYDVYKSSIYYRTRTSVEQYDLYGLISIPEKLNDKISIQGSIFIDGECVQFSENKILNKEFIKGLSLNDTYISKLTIRGKTIIGTYYNGTFTGFVEGKIQVYDVNTETGAISEKLSIDIETLAGLEARIAALENPTT